MKYYVVIGELDGFEHGQDISKFQVRGGDNTIRQLVKEGTVVLREDYEAPKPEAPKPLPDFPLSGGDTPLSLEDDIDTKGLV